MKRRRARALALAAVLAIVAAGCSHHHAATGPSRDGTIPTTPRCAGVSSVSAKHGGDDVEFIRGTTAHDNEMLVRTLTARLAAVGATCTTVSLDPAATIQEGLAAPPNTLRLHLHWVGGPGADMQFRPNLAGYLLRAGELAVRPVLSEAPLPGCLASSNLSGLDPADASSDGRCLHLGRAVRVPKVVSAFAAPTGDPLTWTLRITLDKASTDRLTSVTRRALFASADGFPMGRTTIPAHRATFAVTGRFEGGETEAKALAADLQNPTTEIIGVFGTS